jgi:Nuf2 family
MSYVMLLAASGARSFSLHDIYKPEPKSLIQNLSFVINFARFRNERLEHVNELTTELVRRCCFSDCALSGAWLRRQCLQEQKQQETETARLALQAIKAHIAELT